MKMPESELLCLADRLQAFVAQGSYREAEVFFDEYCRMFKAAVRSLAARRSTAATDGDRMAPAV